MRILCGPLLLCGLLGRAVWAQQPPIPEPSGRWVTDWGQILSPDQEARLEAKLRAYADSTSTQVVIVTVPTVGQWEIAQFATELGQRWGVGQRGYDNGAVILVAVRDRRVFIAIGRGLEGLVPDALAFRIYRHILRPAFQRGAYYEGLDRAVDALFEATQGAFRAPPAPPDADPDLNRIALLVLIIMIALAFVLFSDGGREGRAYRRRRGYWHGGPIFIPGGWGAWSGRGGGLSGGGFRGGGGGFGGGGAGGSW
ncbi:MAG: TPM domain-containing protein [Bacteroidota bacterium]|nr:TPM domain-containing protein [Rhodothermia bacterium]MCS7155170.1 TPM domain-containing protein [Bacteroidota bacterium]MDW8138330.1 TPM domain-containing protein [Bacteroidota bacterium]MDW8286015.1 TPM domain-containing protein [Bacteroidota bacterium]